MKITESTVELIDCMGDDLAVVNAARVSFDKTSDWLYDDDDINCYSLTEQDKKLIKYLAKNKHWSPFAHTAIKFKIKAPIFVARQLVKHQVGLVWNEVSRRYIDTEPEFYFPKEWRKRADNIKQGSSDELITKLRYNCIDGIYESFEMKEQIKDSLIRILYLYNNLIDSGICPEQARMVLPLNTMTEWIWTGSLLAFNRVCKLRLDSHAQKETQEIVQKISNFIQPLFPESWEALMQN